MQELDQRIHALYEQDESTFVQLSVPATWRTTPRTPLLVVIHPGDAIERACDWAGVKGGEAVVDMSIRCQTEMAAEIQRKLAHHDVVVVHRLSSSYLQEPGCESAYKNAIDDCNDKGLLLYGDDLAEISAWMNQHIAGIDSTDLKIFMTGAYADAEYGCITAVGKALLGCNPWLSIEISPWAPTDSSNSSPRWQAAERRPKN